MRASQDSYVGEGSCPRWVRRGIVGAVAGLALIGWTASAAARKECPDRVFVPEVTAATPGTLLEGDPGYIESSKIGGNLRLRLGVFHLRGGYLHALGAADEVTKRDGEIEKTGYTFTRSYAPAMLGLVLCSEGENIGLFSLIFEAGAAYNIRHFEQKNPDGSLHTRDKTDWGAAGSFSWAFHFDPLDLRIGFELPNTRNWRDNREYVFSVSTGFSMEL